MLWGSPSYPQGEAAETGLLKESSDDPAISGHGADVELKPLDGLQLDCNCTEEPKKKRTAQLSTSAPEL